MLTTHGEQPKWSTKELKEFYITDKTMKKKKKFGTRKIGQLREVLLGGSTWEVLLY